jgi:hypothetical protein
MNKQLELFTRLGIDLVPIVPGTKKPPGQWGGRKFSEKDFEGNEYAIRLTDNWCVLDVEGPKKSTNGMPFFENLIAGHHEFPETIMWTSPSGGIGALFRCNEMPHINLAQEIGVELRTGIKVHKIPPSAGYELMSEADEIPFVPQFLVELLNSFAKPQIRKPQETFDDISYDNVRTALDAIPPAEDYQTWIKIGMSLKTADFDAFELWEAWSKRATNSECNHRQKWDSFGSIKNISLGSLFYEARKYGWQPTAEIVELPECNSAKNFLTDDSPPLFHKAETELRQAVLPEPQGALKVIRDAFFNEIPQPQFAIGGALFVLTALFQRVTRMIGGQQNMYCVLIGESGSGKTRAHKLVDMFIDASDCAPIMPDPRSTAALKKSLSSNPSQVLLIDEWGQELRQHVYVRSPQQQHQEKIEALLKLYGNPHRLAGHGTAGDTAVAHIDRPRLSVCATGTRDDFIALCQKQDFVTTGMLSRLVVFYGDKLPRNPFDDSGHEYEVPAEVLSVLKDLKQNATNLIMGEGVKEHICGLQEKYWWPLQDANPHITSLCGRMFHVGLQFSSLHALGCKKDTVECVDIDFGLTAALELLKQSIELFELSADDEIEKGVTLALAYVARHSKCAWRDIYRNHPSLSKLSASEKKQVLTALLDSGKVARCPKTQKLSQI